MSESSMINRGKMCQNTYNGFFAITPGIIPSTEIEPWGALQLGEWGSDSDSLDDNRTKGHA